MDVVDAVGELDDERRRVEQLRNEVARVEVDPEARPPSDRLECMPRRDEVIRDLGRVDLEREANPLRLEDVEDRAEALRELVISTFDLDLKSLGGKE